MKKRGRLSVLLMTILLMWCSVVTVYGQEEESEIKEVKVCAVGDNLIHSRIIKSGLQEDGTRDYTDMYRYYKDYLKEYDLCVVNQETVFVEDESEYSSHPKFGSPSEIGLALMDAGFNCVTTATNHVLDKGINSLFYSHGFWTDWGIEPVGTYVYKEIYDADAGHDTENRGVIINKNGIKIGLLNYTYGTNGIDIPEQYKYTIGTLYDKDVVKREMEWLRNKCDVLIVFPHWGVEYQHEPSSYQEEWAQFFADNGADVIIGTHPHVVEPLKYILKSDGTAIPCYYSLGNLISNQDEVPRMLGAAASFKIVKDGDKLTIEDVFAIPTVTHISSYSESFYAKSLWDYTTEEEEQHRMRRIKGEEFSIDNLWELWYSVFSTFQTGRF